MQKHAYLIMAHANFEQLGMLLTCLDHPRNDIYLHIDKRSTGKFRPEALTANITHSPVHFVDPISVSWGGYSQIAAEMLLLEAATRNGPYGRYHLLTGGDLPLRTQDEIHRFFDGYEDVEFISGGNAPEGDDQWFLERIRYVYPFQDCFKRDSFWGKILRSGLVRIQKSLKLDRLRGSDMVFNIGSAYFDITDRFARYVVSQKEQIRKVFRRSFCADELFLQWVYLHWENANPRYHSNRKDHPYIQEIYFDVCRAIDWTRGNPYTYKEEDYDMLMESGCLFGRKFDDKTSPILVKQIIKKVKA